MEVLLGADQDDCVRQGMQPRRPRREKRAEPGGEWEVQRGRVGLEI